MVQTLEPSGSKLRVTARARARTACCPRCGTTSSLVHGRYRRRLKDATVAGQQVEIDLVVRRWRCREPVCVTVTFAEQIPGLTSPHSRYTPPATRMIEAIGLALAGRPGARMAAWLGLVVGRDTLLRRVRGLSDPGYPR